VIDFFYHYTVTSRKTQEVTRFFPAYDILLPGEKCCTHGDLVYAHYAQIYMVVFVYFVGFSEFLSGSACPLTPPEKYDI